MHIRYIQGNNRGNVAAVPIGSLAQAKWLVDRGLAVWVDPSMPAHSTEPAMIQTSEPGPAAKALAAPPQDTMVKESEATKTTNWGRRGRKHRKPRGGNKV